MKSRISDHFTLGVHVNHFTGEKTKIDKIHIRNLIVIWKVRDVLEYVYKQNKNIYIIFNL